MWHFRLKSNLYCKIKIERCRQLIVSRFKVLRQYNLQLNVQKHFESLSVFLLKIISLVVSFFVQNIVYFTIFLQIRDVKVIMTEVDIKDTLCKIVQTRLEEIERELEGEDVALDEELGPFIEVLDGNSFILLTFYKQIFDITFKLLRERKVLLSSSVLVDRLVNILKNFNSTIYTEIDWLKKKVNFDRKDFEIGLDKLNKKLAEFEEEMNAEIEGIKIRIKDVEDTRATKSEVNELKTRITHLENRKVDEQIATTNERVNTLQEEFNQLTEQQSQNQGNKSRSCK